MDNFDVIRKSVEYLAGLIFIQVEFYFSGNKWRLNTLWTDGHLRHQLTDIYRPGYKIGFPEDADTEYLLENKLEVMNKLKSSFLDSVLGVMNEHEELHEYRVEWLVS